MNQSDEARTQAEIDALNAMPDSPEPEAPAFDFEYICRTFGLIQFGDRAALNLASVIYAAPNQVGGCVLYLPDNHSLHLSAKDMAGIEARLRQREEDVARIRAERIEADAQMEMSAKMRAASDAITFAKLQGLNIVAG